MVARNPELDKLVEHFEVHNRSDGKSPRTVQWYNEALDLFLGWLRGEGMSTCVDDLGEDEVRSFILYLQERKGWRGQTSSSTLNNRVRALRAFFQLDVSPGLHRVPQVAEPQGAQGEAEGDRDTDRRGD